MPGPRTVRVDTDPPYGVRIGAGVLAELAELAAGRPSLAVVADARVAELHQGRLPLPGASVIRVPPGEACKELAVLGQVLEALAAAGLERGSLVVTLGGGATSDLGGLAAALFLRGVDLVTCPTSLLAMVDASVGGKTAVNLRAGKNLAGAFHQPRAVLADLETLATLPAAEWRSGLGEVVKTWLVAGDELEEELAAVEAAPPGEGWREHGALGELIARCVAAKARVVAADAREAGPRRALNLGHTFAHAIERVAGYGRVPHGVAVAAGLSLAVRYGERAGVLADPELPGRLAARLRALGLPADLSDLRRELGPLPAAELAAAMRADKKAAGGRPHLVLVRRAGEPVLDVEADPALLRAVLEEGA